MTDQEKAIKKQRSTLEYLVNSIKSEWSLKKFKCWSDVYHRVGFDERYIEANISKDQLNVTLTWPDLKEFLSKLLSDFDERVSKGILLKQKALDYGKKHEESLTDRLTSGDRKTGRPEDDSFSVQRIVNISDSNNDVSRNANNNSKLEESQEISDEEIERNAENNYGLEPSPNESDELSLLWFQKKAIAELEHKIVIEKKSGVLLVLDAGYGKTFIVMGLARRLLDKGFHVGKTISHIPYIYITPATILEQTARVGKKYFGLNPETDFEILNIEALRSAKGKFWIREKSETKIVDGQEETNTTYHWKPMVQPVVVFLDEAQKAKNAGSAQTKIINAYNDIPRDNCLVSFSATPFSTVSQAKYFAVSCHRPLGPKYGFPEGTVLTNENWPTYAKLIAQGDPDEYNDAAIDRLMKDLKDWIVEPKGIRPQFKPNNMVKRVEFPDKETKEFYEKAWTRFLKKMEKAKKEVNEERYRFVILLKYAMAAELSKAKLFAREMHNAVEVKGKAAGCALKFKGSIIAVVQELEKLGVTRDKISLIWGGGQTKLTKKEKAKAAIRAKASEMEAAGVDVDELIETMELGDVEDRELIELPKHLDLGSQSLEKRQEEIDRFQRGESLYCLYTFKAGGVGLSLPHSDEMTEVKCRRKKSGYVYTEDITLIPTRPRELFSSVTYSEIDMAQSLKRMARIVSLSPTDQTIFLWRWTIEEDIYGILTHKMKSIDVVTKTPSNWLEIIAKGAEKNYE